MPRLTRNAALLPAIVAGFLFLFGSELTAQAAPVGVEFAQSDEEVPCYDFVEVTLKVNKPDAANPFTDVTIEGQFGQDGGKLLPVEGFCDAADGSVFRIRFMPTQPGTYNYSVKFRQGAFEAAHKGRFEAQKKSRRGLVRVDKEYPWCFCWEGTGERYFWNGTTAYWLASLDDESIGKSLDRLDRLRVTRVRSALCGRVKDGRAWFEDVFPSDKFSFRLEPWPAKDSASVEKPGFDVTRFNLPHWQKFERLLRHAWEKDIVVSVIFYVDGARPGTDPFGKAGMGGSDEQRYYRYAVARFAPFSNVMWDVANEYRLFRDDAWAEKMGTLLKQWDPYDHLTSTHGFEDFRFRKSAWADFAMYQCWDEHGGYEFMLKNREEQARTGRPMPQVNEEYGYEDHYPQGWGENRKSPARSAENRRRLAWEMCMAGGYQTTGERANRGETGGGWINGRGDDEMVMLKGYGNLYDFFTSIPFWTLKPARELIQSSKQNPAAKTPEGFPAPRPVLASRNAEGTLAVVYFPSGGEVTLKHGVLQEDLRAMWFNPREGGNLPAQPLKTDTYRAPDANDWVLLLRERCSCSFKEN